MSTNVITLNYCCVNINPFMVIDLLVTEFYVKLQNQHTLSFLVPCYIMTQIYLIIICRLSLYPKEVNPKKALYAWMICFIDT